MSDKSVVLWCIAHYSDRDREFAVSASSGNDADFCLLITDEVTLKLNVWPLCLSQSAI